MLFKNNAKKKEKPLIQNGFPRKKGFTPDPNHNPYVAWSKRPKDMDERSEDSLQIYSSQ